MSRYKIKLKRVRKRERARGRSKVAKALKPIFDNFAPTPTDTMSGLLAGLASASKQ